MLADHAARIQLGAVSRCTIPSENKPLPPPGANVKRGSYKKRQSTAVWNMMINIRLLLLLTVSSRKEMEDALSLTLGLRNMKG